MYPKVSVIMPTRQRAHFLPRAIESVLNQTYPNIEVVVVDDNADDPQSRESTNEAMKKYKDDPRVRHVHNNTTLGGGLSRNVGIHVSNGEYIAFLDDDDTYKPPKIEAQVKFMMMHSLDVSFSDLHTYNAAGKLLEHRTRQYVKEWSAEYLLKTLLIHPLSATPTFMVKREILNQMGGFRNVPMGQDFMFMWDILTYADKDKIKIGYLPCSHIAVYVHNENRISLGQNKITGENFIYSIRSTKKDMLTKKEERYVDFRHYTVLAVTCKRSRMVGDFIKYSIKAFDVSPFYVIKEGLHLFKKRLTSRLSKQPTNN